LLLHVAIVSESDNVNAGDVSIAAAAIQKQVARDFGPIWEIDATVDGFSALEDVPIDYWPIIIEDNRRGRRSQRRQWSTVCFGTSKRRLAAHHESRMFGDAGRSLRKPAGRGAVPEGRSGPSRIPSRSMRSARGCTVRLYIERDSGFRFFDSPLL
jgi:hypothetical protein